MNLKRNSPMVHSPEARKEMSRLRQLLRHESDQMHRHRHTIKQLLELYRAGNPKPLIEYLENM